MGWLDASPSNFEGSLIFLRRDDLYKFEKPYTFKFPPKNGCPQGNLANVKVDGIVIENIRGREEQFQLERNGFTVIKVKTGLEYEDFDMKSGLDQYFRTMEETLKVHLGASRVNVFRHTIRRRHSKFPISTGLPYDFEQPTTVAHIDTTFEGTVDEIRRQYGHEADHLLKKRFQWINFWKPLQGPLNDWPLIMGDSSLIDLDRDVEIADLLYPNLVTENSIMYYNQSMKWYYLSDHSVEEILVFKQMDSLQSACPGVPHTSCYNPLAPKNELPRQSIEGRAMVFYD